MSRLDFFIKQLIVLAKTYFLGLLLLFAYRVFFLFKILDFKIISNYQYDLLKAFVVGFRFDTMVLLYALVPSLLWCAISLCTSSFKYRKFIENLLPKLNATILSIYIILSVVDIYYYDYFQSHINMLVFGFFEDDTKAVMASVWSDYPLVRVLLFFSISIPVVYYLLKRIQKKELVFIRNYAVTKKSAGVVLVFGLYLLGMRGSIGTFPLQIDDSTVSENSSINLLPVNALFALKEAFMFRNSLSDIEGNREFVKKLGYQSLSGAVHDYLNDTLNGNENALFAKTPLNDFARQHPPNVVFLLMESMSNYNLYLHSAELNLLGELEKHFKTDIVYRNFLSSGNGTIQSIEATMVNTPVSPLAQSKFRFQTYESSVAKPFAEAGYNTTFITGGKLGWRNINEFIPYQYFKNVESNQNIKKSMEAAQECEWGVYDEYLFDYIYEKLVSGQNKPQFIYALSTTNHTPFNLPSHYKPFPVTIPKEIISRLKVDETITKKNLTNLQYSNNCIGVFLDKIKSSPLAANTIVVATGDHNNLMLFDFKEEEWVDRLGVPLLMYIPKAYLTNARVDTSIWASHKDIFPTLYPLALSNATYFRGGINLFDPELKLSDYYAVNTGSLIAVNKEGAVKFDADQRFYNWDKFNRRLKHSEQPAENLNLLAKKSRSFYASMSLYILEQTKTKSTAGKINTVPQ